MFLKENSYNDIPKYIRKHIPEFVSIFDDDEIYPLVYELGSYVIDSFSNEKLVIKAAAFINEVLELESSKIEDLIVLQFFQQIYPLAVNQTVFFKSQLSKKSRHIYDVYCKEFKKDNN